MKSRLLILMLLVTSLAFTNTTKTLKMEQKVDQVQIDKWKADFGGVYQFPVGDKTAYLRAPKMLDFKRAFKAMLSDGDIAFGEEMLRALWLDGDKEILDNDEYFIPARKQLKDFFNYGDAEITKLPQGKSKITIGEHSCIVRFITRDDLQRAERQNPSNKTFVTQEKLFERICEKKDEAFKDKNDASIRFPLYQAIEELQNTKVAMLKKL
jgi:hypothetical protein